MTQRHLGANGLTESEAFARYIISSVNQLLECLDAVDADGLNWHPNANESNSLFAIASHTIANVAENVLGTACEIPEYQTRNYEAEFGARGSSASVLRDKWSVVSVEIQKFLSQLDEASLADTRPHPRRGAITGREVLLVAARHAAEHFGQAQLTRDLWLASKTP